ncbi:MAG: hypothetical protein V9H25_12530 [Candidatus Competibacter sp.]
MLERKTGRGVSVSIELSPGTALKRDHRRAGQTPVAAPSRGTGSNKAGALCKSDCSAQVCSIQNQNCTIITTIPRYWSATPGQNIALPFLPTSIPS